MKSSYYNILVDGDTCSSTVLYNSLYGSLVALDPTEREIVERILSTPDDVKKSDSEIIHLMTQMKFLVDDAIDEIGIIKERKRIGVTQSNTLDIVLMPTLNCNFACVYCYEKVQSARMSDETEEAIKLWMTKTLPKHKLVTLLWFGGEPLLCLDRVISISTHAASICRIAGVEFVNHMTTNGYLLDDDCVSRLLSAGVYGFQITIDGPPDKHNKLRIRRDGAETFDRVFENMVRLARADKRVSISMRVNFNQSNIYDIPRLLQMVPNDIRGRLRIVFEPIFGACSLSATDNVTAPEISQALSSHYALAEEIGYPVAQHGLGTGRVIYCYAEREHQVVINHNGDVFKCSVCDFTEEEKVASIQSDGTLSKISAEWDKWVNDKYFHEKCCECIYLPLCMGGCRKMRLQLDGTGSYCTLIPTNVSYALKQIALGSPTRSLMEYTAPIMKGGNY